MLSGQFDANLPDGRCMSRREISEDSDQIASRIAQKLRDAKFRCQIATFEPADTAVLWRDRLVVILAFTLLTALAWGYLLWLSADMAMGGMDFRMIPSGMGLMVQARAPWQATEFAFVFVMWAVMMVGMMTPSATPMILRYARVGRHTPAQDTPFAATVWFAAGYFLVWLAFALLATVVQWALERTALLDAWMASTSNAPIASLAQEWSSSRQARGYSRLECIEGTPRNQLAPG